MTSCRYHCRKCGNHFTSLTAFDSHRSDGDCEKPMNLVETKGTCSISDPTEILLNQKVYELKTTEEYRRMRNAD